LALTCLPMKTNHWCPKSAISTAHSARTLLSVPSPKGCHRSQILLLICLLSFIQNIYFLNHFVNVFIEFWYDRSHSSAVHGRMGAVRYDSRKPFKKDDKRTVIELKYYCWYIRIMSIIQTIYFLNHFVNVSSNFYTTGHVHPCINAIYYIIAITVTYLSRAILCATHIYTNFVFIFVDILL
jgi:hypothetical protein